MFNFLTHIYSRIDNSYCLFIVTLFAFSFKVFLLLLLIIKSIRKQNGRRPWILLAIIATCAAIVDFSWLIFLFSSLASNSILYTIRLFIIRVAWISIITQYQILSIFVERLTLNTNKIKLYQKIFLGISASFIAILLGFTIKDFNCLANEKRSIIEMCTRNIGAVFGLFASLISCLVAIRTIRTQQLPRLIKKQLKILIQFLIAPIWLSDFLQVFPLVFSTTWTTNSYAAASISTLLITYAMFHCMRKVMALRFLNFNDSVQAISRFNFIEGFKEILEQLSRATTIHELNHITQNSFKEAFNIPIGRTHLYIRPRNNTDTIRQEPLNGIESAVENCMSSGSESIISYIQKTKVLTYDELAFSNFYEPKEERTIVLTFLEHIGADIFIPIYEKKNLIAYIIIDRLSRPHDFFSNVEQDEMLVFSNYLGNIINLIQNRNLESLIHREKELQEELFSKHQEVNQYKESIKSFVSNKQHKDIGILFFKNRHFSFGNQAAKELINININQQHGHPITKTLRTLVRNIQEYKTLQSCITKDSKGNRLMFCGMPSIEKNNVIIATYYPDISDLIKRHVDAIKDPSQWDYLLYLETTASGKLINELIPGTGETLLQHKITLLKAALSKKALLLEVAPDDLMPIVEIIHHISLRETLHVIKLQGPSKNNELAIKIFGINPIFASQSQEKPLLEKLSDSGTLYIQNVHHLNIETQEYLAEYIKYGSWRMYKSEQRMNSQVRIICSTNQNLSSLVQEGLFSKELHTELKKHIVSMPSLLTLPVNELHELATEYTEQAIMAHDFKSLLELSDKEKQHIIHQRPISLHELKTKIQNMLMQKSRKNKIHNDITFDHVYPIGDPEIVQAIRLGKHALRDPKMMSLLWHKFKSQTKIASLLGVNKSSVNRRCKDYSLE